MTRKPFVPPFSHVLVLANVSGPMRIMLRPTEEERRGIARLGKLHVVSSFEAAIDITPRADGTILVHGPLRAEVEPICVVTLEPFPERVEEEVDAVYAEANTIEKLRRRAEEADLEFDPPDEIENGVIDIGALAVEFLMLALAPHPKKPGVAFGEYAEPEETLSPFSALKGLKLE